MKNLSFLDCHSSVIKSNTTAKFANCEKQSRLFNKWHLCQSIVLNPKPNLSRIAEWTLQAISNSRLGEEQKGQKLTSWSSPVWPPEQSIWNLQEEWTLLMSLMQSHVLLAFEGRQK